MKRVLALRYNDSLALPCTIVSFKDNLTGIFSIEILLKVSYHVTPTFNVANSSCYNTVISNEKINSI